VDSTALGSVTLAVLILTIALCVLLLLKDRMGALQLVAASVGAGILTTTIKDYIDRARPEVVTQLVEDSGLSYPSGHSLAAASLYLTVAILVCRHLQRTGHQIAILAMTFGIILLVGMTRIPRSALSKRRRQWHVAWGGLGAFAGRVLFVSS
jgi:undecaprenyl-diphosphatase